MNDPSQLQTHLHTATALARDCTRTRKWTIVLLFCDVYFNSKWPKEMPTADRCIYLLNWLHVTHVILIVQVQTASWECTFSSWECLMWNFVGSTIATPCSGWRAWSVGPLDSWPCSLQRYFKIEHSTTHQHTCTSHVTVILLCSVSLTSYRPLLLLRALLLLLI